MKKVQLKTKFEAINKDQMENMLGGAAPCTNVCDNAIVTTCCPYVVLPPKVENMQATVLFNAVENKQNMTLLG